MAIPAGFTQGPVMGLYRTSDGSGPYFLDADGRPSQGLPSKLMTDNNGVGPNSRLRVDIAQTGFFAGREFRTYLRLNLALSEVIAIKIVVPINVILFALDTVLTSGWIELETVVGGVEEGVFATPLPVIARNTMTEVPTPVYVPQVTLATGGTITGGTVLDILVNKTADVANFASSVGAGSEDERGVAANTYYFRITGVQASVGVLKARWEERP